MARSRKAATAPRPSGPAGGSAWPAACQSSSLRGAKQLATSSPIVAGFISSVAHRQCSVGISSGGEASRSRCRRGSYGLGTAPALMTASFRGGCARQRRRQCRQGAHALGGGRAHERGSGRCAYTLAERRARCDDGGEHSTLGEAEHSGVVAAHERLLHSCYRLLRPFICGGGIRALSCRVGPPAARAAGRVDCLKLPRREGRAQPPRKLCSASAAAVQEQQRPRGCRRHWKTTGK